MKLAVTTEDKKRRAEAAARREAAEQSYREALDAEMRLGSPNMPIEIHERIEDDPRRGFKHSGEFFRAVMLEGKNFSNPKDERLRVGAVAPTTVGSELSGADGGFIVPMDFATEVATLIDTDDSLIPFCDDIETESNAMSFPTGETTPWGTDGVRANWQTEATLGTQTKPKLRGHDLRLNKLLALVPVTDELVADATSLKSYLPAALASGIRWKANEALLFGPGTAQPLGVFNSGALITIAKEAAQATATLALANLTKMIARMPPGSFSRAVWLFNSDCFSNIWSVTGATSPIFEAGGADLVPSAKAAVAGVVLGRPAIISAHAKAFSAQGDVMLVDMFFQRLLQKAGGAQLASSMHVYFDADATAFRVSFRLDAQPKLTTTIAPFNGSTQLSPFVQLGAR